jgi:hypothetical protein
MTYAKPQLLGQSAISAIGALGNPIKIHDFVEPPPHFWLTDPAYQADE